MQQCLLSSSFWYFADLRNAARRQISREKEREIVDTPWGPAIKFNIRILIFWFSFCHFALQFRLSCVFDCPKKRKEKSRKMRPSWTRFNFNFVELFHCQLCSSLCGKEFLMKQQQHLLRKGFHYAFSEKETRLSCATKYGETWAAYKGKRQQQKKK